VSTYIADVRGNMEVLNREISQSKVKLIELLREINGLNEFKSTLSKSNREMTQKFDKTSRE